MDGWFIIDKPRGIGSTKVVSILKRMLRPKKIGHAGTLDPLAEGLLIVAVGEATKLIRFVMGGDKEYEFDVIFGRSTATDDEEGEVVAATDSIPGKEEIEKIIPSFLGETTQVPPKYSAVKIAGRRAYDLARGDVDFEIKARTVRIDGLELLAYENAKAKFKVRCSKGTYVRALARDLAVKLNSLGHVSYLRRTACGKFSDADAILLSKAESLGHNALNHLYPVKALLDDIPAIAIGEGEAARLAMGQKIIVPHHSCDEIIVTYDEKVVAIAAVMDGVLIPKRIIL